VAVGTQDLYDLPACGNRCRDLADLVGLVAQVGVNLGKKPHLFLEGRRTDRVLLAVELAVGALGCCSIVAAMAAGDGGDRFGGSRQRRKRKLARMRVADSLAGDRPEPEALIGVEAAALQATVVEGE